MTIKVFKCLLHPLISGFCGGNMLAFFFSSSGWMGKWSPTENSLNHVFIKCLCKISFHFLIQWSFWEGFQLWILFFFLPCKIFLPKSGVDLIRHYLYHQTGKRYLFLNLVLFRKPKNIKESSKHAQVLMVYGESFSE